MYDYVNYFVQVQFYGPFFVKQQRRPHAHPGRFTLVTALSLSLSLSLDVYIYIYSSM